MQLQPHYTDVVAEVGEFLQRRRAECIAAGIAAGRIVLDPGIGFGKTQSHNLELLRRLPELAALGSPLLLGVSRKSFIGRILGQGVEGRLHGGLALAALCVQLGARIIRTHDVAPTVEAVRVVSAVMQGS
jgi:dihydropteroate synthase